MASEAPEVESLRLDVEKLFQSYVPGGLLHKMEIRDGKIIMTFQRRPRKG